ncbi:hypothetical protein SAMN04487819_11145 [Actinopolyspora alba]|uniref:Uncharacterized protein n=1 Tax=Actinopolyspora alba TaxID=673379 RepID=A0A1I1ZMG3_9ACTN|nr:hypothetical protein SAMN04487819_11145 [Actinopolyspora alba]
MTCIVLGTLSGIITAFYLAMPYVAGVIGSPQFLLGWLFCTLMLGLQIYNWRSIHRRALRQEAEGAAAASDHVRAAE